MSTKHAEADHCTDDGCARLSTGDARPGHLRRALRLEYLTVGWNLAEGGIALAAALASGSVALFGFGIDSFVESASGSVLIWRLIAESRGRMTEPEIERIDQRAHRLVGVSLFALAAWVTFDASRTLLYAERPDPSVVGIALTAVSILVMQWLARAKRRAASDLGSRALDADAFQTTACVYLSVAALGGMGLNLLLGWWWADPVAALVIAALLVREGREAWQGRDCC